MEAKGHFTSPVKGMWLLPWISDIDNFPGSGPKKLGASSYLLELLPDSAVRVAWTVLLCVIGCMWLCSLVVLVKCFAIVCILRAFLLTTSWQAGRMTPSFGTKVW